jgi:hypothetical protein
MAKGNDGNLLQHWIEAHLATRLLCQAHATNLHVALTHGMKPFERFDARKVGVSGIKRLDRWLAVAQTLGASSTDPAVVTAYRACKASAEHYPNTGEILAAVAGRANLIGSISECDESKWHELSGQWHDSQVRVLQGSWRQHLVGHACPQTLGHPWLFSMDPMTFVQDPKDLDDASLRASDLLLLKPVLENYFRSGKPGAVTIFCFSLQKKPGVDRYRLFKAEIASLANSLSCPHGFCKVPLANPHVGAVLATDANLIRDVVNDWNARGAA